MESVLVIVHLFLAIGLVALILIQHGKGADMGAAFGSGASATISACGALAHAAVAYGIVDNPGCMAPGLSRVEVGDGIGHGQGSQR